MNKHTKDRVRLQHILQAIGKIKEFTKEVDFDKLSEDDLILSAVERQVEIIGEAANHISEELRAQNAQIPWRPMINFRNIIAHEYFQIDLGILWDIIIDKIPILEKDIQKIIDKLAFESIP